MSETIDFTFDETDDLMPPPKVERVPEQDAAFTVYAAIAAHNDVDPIANPRMDGTDGYYDFFAADLGIDGEVLWNIRFGVARRDL